MSKILIKSLVGSSLLLGGMTLRAQQYNPQQYPPQGDYQRQDRDRGFDRDHDRNMQLNRVRPDLDVAQSRAYGGDRWRIARAKSSINEFQSDMNAGHYDRRALDVAIDTMQRLVDGNGLPYRSQQNLSNDLTRLRDPAISARRIRWSAARESKGARPTACPFLDSPEGRVTQSCS
jgi:hypothetical protein